MVEEEDEGGEVDESGVEAKDVELVMTQVMPSQQHSLNFRVCVAFLRRIAAYSDSRVSILMICGSHPKGVPVLLTVKSQRLHHWQARETKNNCIQNVMRC